MPPKRKEFSSPGADEKTEPQAKNSNVDTEGGQSKSGKKEKDRKAKKQHGPDPDPDKSAADRRKDFTKRDEAGPSMKKGGEVKKTGKVMVHKGELIIPEKLAEKLKKLLK